MSADDLAVVKQFLAMLEAAANSGDRDALFPFLAPDVDWLTPQRHLRGTDEVRDQASWPLLSLREGLEVDLEETTTDLGGGRTVSNVHEVYRVKTTGDVAYSRDHRIDVTIREGRIAKFELRFAG
jgi:ketosteroid isomerase-like protein